MKKQPQLFTLLVSLHALVLLAAIAIVARRPADSGFDRASIAVIPVEGVITMGRGALGHGVSVDELVTTIDELAEKPDVKALVLKINSPGGSVGAVQAIYEALQRFRKTGKPIVSTFGDIAASGGYYIACAGDKIVAHPGTLTGSIGVVMQMPNVTGLLQKIGVSMNTIISGDMKDMGSPFRAMTASERDYFRSLIGDAYGQFFEAVQTGRHIPSDELKAIADGRVMSGQMAMKVHLVDALGGTKEAIELAKGLAGLTGKKPRIVERREKPSLEKMLSLLSSTALSGLTAVAETGPRLSYLAN